MTLAEQVLQLKTDIDEVYKAGKKATGGVVECDIDHEELYNNGYSEGYDVGFDAGYNEGQENMPNLIEQASVVQFPNCNVFGKAEVELNLGEQLTTLANFITVTTESNKNTILEHLTITCSGLPKSMQNFMNCNYQYRDTVLKKITLNFNTENVTNFSNTFNCLTALEEIDGTPLDLSLATNVSNIFNYNLALKEVRFKANSIKLSIYFAASSLLSTISLQSIIDGLATVTTKQTLTLHSSVSVTDEQVVSASGKNWEIV